MHELVSLVQVDVENRELGPFSPAAFPNRAGGDNTIWSTSALEYYPYAMRKDDFALISTTFVNRSEPYDTLCVRRGFSTAMPEGERMVRHGTWDDGEQPYVDDRVSGLSYQACHSEPSTGACIERFVETTVHGGEGAAHCENLTWAGFSDWRLPTFKEMYAVFDHRKRRTADIDGKNFNVDDNNYLLVGNGPLFSMRDGDIVGIGIPENTYPVLCVRNTGS